MPPKLLPIPKKIELGDRACPVDSAIIWETRVPEPRVKAAVDRWRSALPAPQSGTKHQVKALIAVDRSEIVHLQGYRLTIDPGRIELVGGSAAGCFHGLQTLGQLTDFAAGKVSCCTIVDWPTFTTRGLLHDITRGKVPKLSTLKVLVDRLAAMKVNQLQLYFEHAFVFSFDSEICTADQGITPAEARELHDYSEDRFVELIPAMATLGHMGRILSMPKYRHLAEIETATAWSEQRWPTRARGLTLDCVNPAAWRLVENMWADVLDAFPSETVNICCDEPWDLGKGKNQTQYAQRGRGRMYLDHVCRTHELLAASGRRTQFWSDVVRGYPELFFRVPRDATVLHWGYDQDADYDGTQGLTDAGLRTFVCPATTGCKRILNAMGLAEKNITQFALAGHKYGADGLINTDWGDHGHFNSLACSWHGIAVGAALGWTETHPTGAAFDELFLSNVLRLHDADLMKPLRHASKWADEHETWRLFWTPEIELQREPKLPSHQELDDAMVAARDAGDRLRRALDVDSDGNLNGSGSSHGARSERGSIDDAGLALDLRELELACRFTELLAERLGMMRSDDTAASVTGASTIDRAGWSDRMQDATRTYAECWSVRNKSSGIGDIVAALRRVIDEPSYSHR